MTPANLTSAISWRGAYLGPCVLKAGTALTSREYSQGEMTAIVSSFTSSGFVIGADGRSLGKGSKVICDCSQKIFNFTLQHVNVAYAWCGETHVVNEANDILYNLNTITHEALRSATKESGRDFFTFIQRCCGGILDNIIKTPVVRKVTNSDSVPDEAKARMLLNGYFDDGPFTTEFYVRQTDRIRVRAENVYNPIPVPTRNLFSGCKEQNQSMKYANVVPGTAKEALEFVSGYIQECIDNPNPDCFIVGGHRHIAQLDPNGFSWIEKPKNSN